MGDTGRSLGSIEEMAVQTPEALGSLRGTKERGTGLWDVSDHPVCAYSGKDWVEFGTTGGGMTHLFENREKPPEKPDRR